MPSLTEWTVPAGYDLRARIALTDVNGVAVTTFTSDAILTLKAWPGDDLPQVAADELPAASWVNDGSDALVELYFPAAFTGETGVGAYPVFLQVQAGDTVANRIGTLIVTASPGTGTADDALCTYDDCLTYAPYLTRMIADSESLQANLAEQRAIATTWLVNQIVSRVRRDVEEQYRRHSPVAASNTLEITAGVDAGYDWGPSIYPEPSIRDQVETIRTYLTTLDDNDARYLMTDDGKAVEIVAKYAIHLACEGQLPGGDNRPDYQSEGRRKFGEAVVALAGYTARIDTDADGVADYEITP